MTLRFYMPHSANIAFQNCGYNYHDFYAVSFPPIPKFTAAGSGWMLCFTFVANRLRIGAGTLGLGVSRSDAVSDISQASVKALLSPD